MDSEEKVEQLEERIRKLEEQLDKQNSSQTNNQEKDEETISRRDFLKKAGMGAAGLGALAMTPASALNIRTSNDFSYSGSGTEYFKINNGGPVEVKNSNLDLNQNQLNGLVLEQTSSTPSNAVQGRFWYDTTDNEPKYHDGSNEQSMTGAGTASTTDDGSDFTVHKAYTSQEKLVDISTGGGTLMSGIVNADTGGQAEAKITVDGGPTYTIEAPDGGQSDQADNLVLPPIEFDTSLEIVIMPGGGYAGSGIAYTK